MSAILSIDTLNDFIAPSVACIKPIETLPSATDTDPNEVQIHDPSNPAPTTSDPAQISLTDCLACSGCVTSAEAVLVSLQSHSEVLNALDSGPNLELHDSDEGLSLSPEKDVECKLYVASISPQTLASLSTTLSLPSSTTLNIIHQFLSGPKGLASGGKYNNKFHWVVDTNAAREACLVLGAEEVLSCGSKSQDASTKIPIQKPILSSSCPGWICYAEKTHPHILPHLSRLKSPQALTGTLLKTVLSKKYNISPEKIWHVAIMPCFDKKLEASREELTDLYWDTSTSSTRQGVRDVDCVITSKEVLMLAETRKIDLLSLPRSALIQPAFPDTKLDRFLFPSHRRSKKQQKVAAGTSGGHLWYILEYISSLHPSSTIQSVRGRNADVIDYTVTSPSGEILFKAARYYGFRNIQNLVRRLKPAKASRMPGATRAAGGRKVGKDGMEQGYVEVMACPGGCTNGGGQVKVDDPIVTAVHSLQQNYGTESTFSTLNPNGIAKPAAQEQKEWLAQVDEAYFSAEDNAEEEDSSTNGTVLEPGDEVDGISPLYIRDILAHWAGVTGLKVDRLVYTSYREVISDVGKKVSDTERVVTLAGKIGGGW